MIVPFSPEELAELAVFDAEIDASPAYDRDEIKAQRELDRDIQDEKLMPQQLRKRKADRAYYQRNKDRINQRCKAYDAAHADAIKAYRREYYAVNADGIRERRKAYAAANAEQIAEYQRQYHIQHKQERNAYSRQYRLQHLDSERERFKAWKRKNSERYRDIKRNHWERHKDAINAERRAKHNRHVIYITHDGRTQTITQWAAEIGINRGTLASRIERGWDVERALTTPV